MRATTIVLLLTIFFMPGLGRTEPGGGGEPGQAMMVSGESPATQSPQKSPEPANEPKDVPKKSTFAFDPETVKVLPEGSGWQVVAVSGTGEDKILFNTDSQEAATKAAGFLKFYGVSEVLEVSMPGEVEYVFSNSGKTTGKFNGEQCTEFDPATLAVTEFKGKYQSATREEVNYTQWSVDSGKRMVMRFNEKSLAEEMVSIARKYGCRNRCHVGELWYLRK